MRRLFFFLMLLLGIGVSADNLAPVSPDGKCVSFRLMQFNVLQGWDSYNASETVGHEWLNRREGVVLMLKDTDPDIVCVQEARKLQCSYLKEQLPQYDQVLYPKDGIETNGGQRDLIMYKSSKFELLQWDKFWFSTTPEYSSYSWDAGTPKLTIRAQFRSLEGMPKTFWVYCTHFFPSGDEGKQMCSNMILDDMKKYIAPDEPVFLCGDLNLNYGDTRLDTLLTYMGDAATSAPESDGPLVCTYSGFNPNNTKTLDHIYGRNIYFKSYHVVNDKTKYGMEFISDHYPLYSDVQIPVLWEEGTTYEPSGDLELKNNWVRMEKTPYANILLSASGAYRRGFCVKDNVLYVAGRKGNSSSSPSFLDKYDAGTGLLIERLSLSTNVQVKTYPCNDIVKDDAGNLFIYNYALSVSSVPVKLFQVDTETGEATLKAEIKSVNGTARLEHLTLKGDVNSGNFIIYVPVSSGTKVLKFTFRNGTQESEEVCTLTEFVPSTVSKLGLSPRLFLMGDEKCVINSATTLPALYDLTTGKVIGSVANAVNDVEDLVPGSSSLAANGFTAFDFNNKKYVVYPKTDHTSPVGYQFVVSSVSGDMDFSTMKYLWTIPADGFGTINNSNSECLVDYCLNSTKDSLFIYAYVPCNGLASYVLTDKNLVSVKATEANLNRLEITVDGTSLKVSQDVDKIDVYDVIGRKILSKSHSSRLSMNAFPRGLYIVKASIGEKSISQKIWIR